ncbi:uncharacterized protein K02A2.6-like [Uranotaenia lowii]|uniref:uncharacterized protein K02A2.6-like n=1 Tax=Uranotaenia lowii TaxID=190385 RepID=UPI0024798B07|nr:uncharacterized protein K02A2.6-like [Uranotaenia lowii]
MQRMKSIARSYVYWPNIDCDIEDFVRKCSSCAIAAKAPVKSTLSSWPIPTEPWTRLHLDYAGPVRGKFYLVIIDACSKWPEIFATNNTTASTTVAKVRECISRFGCPHSIVTDNGTQFTSELFAKMCQEYGIEHVRTPAFHPQSNGQAERFVDTLKRALLKMGEKNPDEALLTFLETYRYTPNASLPQNKSPAEALLGRRIRTKFDLMKRSRPQPTLVNENQNKQYNQKHGSKQRLFQPNEKVFALIHIRNQQHWAQGIVIERKGQVVYTVLLDDPKRKGLIRSHVNQLRSRAASDMTSTEQQIPLQVLLEEFKIPQSRSEAEDVGQPADSEADVQQDQLQTLPEIIDEAGPSHPRIPEEVRITRKRAAKITPPRKRRLPSYFQYYELF